MLNEAQIEEIKYLITSKKESEAIEMLVRLTNCDEVDAKNLVYEYDYQQDFELLLDKHWIEKRDFSAETTFEDVKLTKKEKLNLARIFLPVFVMFILVIILIIFY